MKAMLNRGALVAAALAVAGTYTGSLQAAAIGPAEIMAIPAGVQASGNGTIPLRLMTFSGSEITNEIDALNIDNGNNTLPNSGGADTGAFAESYVTTAGELQAFYTQSFGAGVITNMTLFLDLNETGGGMPLNQLAKFDVLINPTISVNPAGDLTSAQQAGLDQSYTGGTLAAWLLPEPAANIPVNAQGAGFADYAIFTGINPYALNVNDVVLFNISANTLNNGAEEIFISGQYSGTDIPEPAAILSLTMAGLMLVRRQRPCE